MDTVIADERWRRYEAWKAANQELERVRMELRIWQEQRCAAERAAREARDSYRETLRLPAGRNGRAA